MIQKINFSSGMKQTHCKLSSNVKNAIQSSKGFLILLLEAYNEKSRIILKRIVISEVLIPNDKTSSLSRYISSLKMVKNHTKML